jgi:hypothetical protein
MERTKILFGNDSNRAENSGSNNQSTAASLHQNSRLNKANRNSNSNSTQNLPAATQQQQQSASNLNDSSKQLFEMLKSNSNSGTINRNELINSLRSCSKSDIQTVIGLVSSQDGMPGGSDATSSSTTLTHNQSSSTSLSSLVSSSRAQSDNLKDSQQQQPQLSHQHSYENKSINDNSGRPIYALFVCL